MSHNEEITLVVILATKPGKGQRFIDLSTQAYKNFAPKEPGCLQFQIIGDDSASDNADEQRWSIIERYESKEALTQHQSTASYRLLFEAFMAEELLAGTPVSFEGKALSMGHSHGVSTK
ncbi:Putative antibiotic biosynthesis monooxygenase domain-containing protein [Septoria linicola]|uniref:Antibiotic biosynthesis monooxygenase domain-containing protein n=1 Tax=Septoria linicola TaxID=215465 RepID=A0A9Q9ALU4_9PEZI|nr:putative antibiotic biosynthesis monooxygenase domain-containing protein [Septoria linicola]USW50439.1 Putative antibiotic biosynthesis monooxygenase domain-containing protein [Septoria linicola]